MANLSNSNRQIAAEVGVDRRTVDRASGAGAPHAPRPMNPAPKHNVASLARNS
jgi:hypothetical protein